MAIEIKVPTLGESVSEATVASWLKKQGEHVETDEPLLELETLAAPERSVELRRRSEEREDDPFDLPPE